MRRSSTRSGSGSPNDEAGQDVDLDDYLDRIQLDGHSLHETDDGTVVTPYVILLAMLLGTVRGILYDPEGEILRFGRERRLFSKAQAATIRSKYRRCHPYGCDRPRPASPRPTTCTNTSTAGSPT